MGFGDSALFISIVSIFIITGVMLPFMHDALGSDQTINANVQIVSDSVGQELNDNQNINVFTVIKSVVSMFFWSFGALPFWIDTLFIILRLTLAWLIIRVIRGV